MTAHDVATPERNRPSESGLDTSNGLDFVQQRIARFAKIIALISLAFLIVGTVFGLALQLAGPSTTPTQTVVNNTARMRIANVAGLVLLTGVWLLCRWGRFPLRTLERLDAVALIGSSTAWAFFIQPPLVESIRDAVVSVAMTVLARAIMVPSKAGRTLRLTTLAATPVTGLMWLSLGAFSPAGPAPAGAAAATMTAVFQTLLVIAVIWMATITSRTLYDLRRSVREANEVGQYVLEEKLGEGGMGEVWRARHRRLVRSAAVKIIRPEFLASTEKDAERVLRRFEREALTTAALRSPHTVQLYDFGEAEDGTLFYVMELLVGIDLESLVSRFGPIPAERAIHILKQVCHSLAEAHQNGVTHRDVKPANIFVSGTGTELDFVKVLDFGLVQLRSLPAGVGANLTAEATVACTPAYAAPEIARGEASYDHRVDIYAVGCVAYWLVTGHLVFEATTSMQMLINHASTPPPRPQTRAELPIPPDLDELIMDCLAKDPGRRPADAALLAHRLGNCHVPEPWTHERAERWWRTHIPAPVRDRPVAEVVMSREGTPIAGRALLPRRRNSG
jgi:tRNA A-37 threonylcarbamoyl transferase component Bud32